MTDATEYTPERWVYLGVAQGNNKKKVACFRTGDGTRRTYQASSWNRSLAPGYIYVVQVDGTSIRSTVPEWTGEKAEDYDTVKLDARGNEIQMERKSLEAKARTGNSPELDELLTQVNNYAARQISMAGKEALVTLLIKTVWQARRPR